MTDQPTDTSFGEAPARGEVPGGGARADAHLHDLVEVTNVDQLGAGPDDDVTALDDDSGDATVDVARPPLPPARFVDLSDDDRGDLGTIVVRDHGPTASAAADGTPVALLHGWTATADLNWFRCYDGVANDRRVFAYDHRGHGSGIRTKKRFRLEDCADDVVAVADRLGIDRFVVCGYSMGGPIAQLVWRRHPERVAGLVLCATAATFSSQRAERWSFFGLTGLAALARVTPEQARGWLTEQFYLQRKADRWEPWAIEEAASHDWRLLLEAGSAIGDFDSTDWIGDVDVPVSLLVTTRDQVVSPRRQTQLFELIRHADVYRIDGMHDACVADADHFAPALVRALDSIERRR
ncbi:MAG: alpha/beta fold hydrolase [Actinomycetota bacterium]